MRSEVWLVGFAFFFFRKLHFIPLHLPPSRMLPAKKAVLSQAAL